MSRRSIEIVCLFVAGALYWLLVSAETGHKEPWDSPQYWTLAYPISLIFSAIGGAILRRGAWLAGVLLIFSQLPVMWINNGAGSLIVIGVLFLGILAVPAAVVSALAGKLMTRVRPDS